MAELVLPTKPLAPTTFNPRSLIIYGPPKSGKTHLLSQLENNLIVDLQEGAVFYDALRVDGSSLEKLREIIGALAAGHPYKYITLDPITDLEELVLPRACELYQQTLQGKGWRPVNDNGKTDHSLIKSLPKGLGYMYVRQAFMAVLEAFKGVGATLILTAHVKDKFVGEGDSDKVDTVELMLTGQLRQIVPSWVDAIGRMVVEKNKRYLQFNADDQLVCGGRAKHLRGKKLLVSELVDDELVTYWNNIFIP